MEGWRRPEPSGTNRPSFSFARRETTRRGGPPPRPARPPPLARLSSHSAPPSSDGSAHRQSGGYGGGAPPLPIPNREVKPARADGTAHERGRVGCRHLTRPPTETSAGGPLFFAPAPARREAAHSRHAPNPPCGDGTRAVSRLGDTPPRPVRDLTSSPSHRVRRAATRIYMPPRIIPQHTHRPPPPPKRFRRNVSTHP